MNFGDLEIFGALGAIKRFFQKVEVKVIELYLEIMFP
jgi:hypothetical protein